MKCGLKILKVCFSLLFLLIGSAALHAGIINPSFEEVDAEGNPVGWSFISEYSADPIITFAHAGESWATDGAKSLELKSAPFGTYYYLHTDYAGVMQVVTVSEDVLNVDVRKLHVTSEWNYEGWMSARIRLCGDALWQSPNQPSGNAMGWSPEWSVDYLQLDVSGYSGRECSLELEVVHDAADMVPGGGLVRSWSQDWVGDSPWVQFDNVRFTEAAPEPVVPEPSCFLLLGVGGAAYFEFVRKRRIQ